VPSFSDKKSEDGNMLLAQYDDEIEEVIRQFHLQKAEFDHDEN